MDFVSRSNGGIFEAERRLQQTLFALKGVDVQVVGLQDFYTEVDSYLWKPLSPIARAVRGPHAFGYAPGFSEALLDSKADLAYCAGLWKYPSVASLRWARQTGKPMIVAPHGMLDPWAVANSRSKKRIAGWLFQNAQLHQASCIRALCEPEAKSIRAYGLENSIAVIPNGIDLPEGGGAAAEGESPPWHGVLAPGRKVLLFLSRIHPKKGLVNLLHAWAANRRSDLGGRNSDWALAIAGWDQGGHENTLKRLATDLRIPWADVRDQKSEVSGQVSLVFLGPQFREGKSACYRNCDGFILPSFSEGVPMVVLEAWAYGKPVLMTGECNLPAGFDSGAALRIGPEPESIARGLSAFFSGTEIAFVEMGRRGLDLVRQHFTWETVAAQMKSVYDWILGGGSPPECIRHTRK